MGKVQASILIMFHRRYCRECLLLNHHRILNLRTPCDSPSDGEI